MTVLAKYARLEAEGVWRPDPDAQRRDVIVSIGEATITIGDLNGGALAHWSLPAMTRINPGETPALYKPGPDTPELLEIADPEMVAAVDKVLKSIRTRHSPKRRGRWGRLAFAAALLAGAILWLPDAITRYTASLVPGVARASIGEALLGELDRVAGAPCAASAGLRALDALEARLFDGTPTRLIVLKSALTGTTHLPGGTILIGHTLVEDHETPEVLAGYLLAEDLRRSETDPLARLLDAAGLRAALRLLLQGKVSEADLKPMAEAVVADQPAPVSDTALLARMAAAQVPPAPYGYALDFSGETTARLVSAVDATLPPILNDDNWIALQRICED